MASSSDDDDDEVVDGGEEEVEESSSGPSMPALTGGRGGDAEEDDDDEEEEEVPVAVAPVAAVPVAAAKPTKKRPGRPKGAKNKKQKKDSPQSGKKSKTTKTDKGMTGKEKKKAVKKMPYFSDPEDIALCKAYINVSQCNVVGANQKSDKFWEKIMEKYHEFLDQYDHDREEKLPRGRDQISMYNRFSRKIQPDVTKFNTIYREKMDGKESGESAEDVMKNALWSYDDYWGKPFKYVHCLPTLWGMPKFDPMIDDSDDEMQGKKDDEDYASDVINVDDNDGTSTIGTTDGSTAAGSNKIGKVQGSKSQRPQGKKSTLKMNEQMEHRERMEKNKIEALNRLGEKIGNPTDNLAKAIRESSKAELEMKKNDQKMEYIGKLMSLGMTEEAKKLMGDLQRSLFQEAKTPPRQNRTPQTPETSDNDDTHGTI
jgi:hypothetical protein